MRKRFYLIPFLSLLGLSNRETFAQSQPCKGYFIRQNAKDTVFSTVMVPVKDKKVEWKKLQWKVVIKDNFSTIDMERMPGEIKEFGFSLGNKSYVFWSVPNPFDKSGPGNKMYDKMFLRLLKPGFCKIFAGYTEIKGVNMEGKPSKQDLILKANNKEWLVLQAGNAKDDLIFYFSDFPALAEKIKNDTYTEKDIDKIVTEYNQHKRQNKP
jgi:hypothetical protein